ncbi:unnamed protein product [Vitrella brassicaformis CCMP3155]|uniref:PPM-type phosphatase domain-containing protein n=2 Tax=Vitrella brassicaformis TaxID=1169539 RepID=A0A0G4F0Y1_VITBC|nr:unnamed protein product [Vitrella brassicaformis CCMP3155]|mmetsp:Transcript_32128/g.79617  ORF Transcript_32128/g.79617 Transcript_32128/m.79617 type:complete len:643 (+) Transcript_32128:30-1958(+)|eukprot:CEM04813.1 unnamed protein product [Vitrella brassicaformis CCMP3155]
MMDESEQTTNVLDVGCYQIQGTRQCQEDRFVRGTLLWKQRAMKLLAVLDGHGGSEAVDYVKSHLIETIEEFMQRQAEINIDAAVVDAFWALDQRLREHLKAQNNSSNSTDCASRYTSGTTALVCIMDVDEYHLANLGDSRAVLSYMRKDLKKYEDVLTRDHTAKDADEMRRIGDEGGYVETIDDESRLQGQWTVTRAFGDFDRHEDYSKPAGMSAVPEIKVVYFEDGADIIAHQFLLLATDGLFERLAFSNTQDLASTVRRSLNRTSAQATAQHVVDMAYKRRAKGNVAVDNTSMILVVLTEPGLWGQARPSNYKRHTRIQFTDEIEDLDQTQSQPASPIPTIASEDRHNQHTHHHDRHLHPRSPLNSWMSGSSTQCGITDRSVSDTLTANTDTASLTTQTPETDRLLPRMPVGDRQSHTPPKLLPTSAHTSPGGSPVADVRRQGGGGVRGGAYQSTSTSAANSLEQDGSGSDGSPVATHNITRMGEGSNFPLLSRPLSHVDTVLDLRRGNADLPEGSSDLSSPLLTDSTVGRGDSMGIGMGMGMGEGAAYGDIEQGVGVAVGGGDGGTKGGVVSDGPGEPVPSVTTHRRCRTWGAWLKDVGGWFVAAMRCGYRAVRNLFSRLFARRHADQRPADEPGSAAV